MPYATGLTDIEVNHFFDVEMGMPEPTMVKLREEGVERPEHLVECNAEDVNRIAEALSEPGGLVPSSGAARKVMTLSPGVRIGARVLIKLEAEMHVMKH